MPTRNLVEIAHKQRGNSMSLWHLLARRSKKRSSRRASPGFRLGTHLAARLCVERLEDRRLLSYSVIDLGTLGGSFAVANGINNQGQVTGGSTDIHGNVLPYIWSQGVMRALGTLGGP